MDPLSITASVLTVGAAAITAVRGLKAVSSVKDAEHEARALLTKASEFRALLRVLKTASLDPSSSAALPELQTFVVSVERLVDEFEVLVSESVFKTKTATTVVATGSSCASQKAVSKRRWLFAKSRIERVECRLQEVRQNMTCALSGLLVMQMRDMHAIGQDMGGLRTQSDAHHAAVQDRQEILLNRIDGIQGDIQDVRDGVGGLRQLLNSLSLPESNVTIHLSPTPPQTAHPVPDDKLTATPRKSGSTSRTSSPTPAVTKTNTIRSGSSETPCPKWCRCTCHTVTRLATPKLFSSVFGVLCLGLNGFPPVPRCDYKKCRGRTRWRATFYYYFPTWLVRVAIPLVAGTGSWHSVYGDGFAVSMPRVIASESDIFNLIYLGKLAEIRDMFARRLASPYDTYENGVSVLHYAVWLGQLDVCRFIIQSGADRFLVNKMGYSAADNAFDEILKSPGSPLEQGLSSIFVDNEFIDNRNFTALHKLASGISSSANVRLDDYLSVNDSELDAQDTLGRTPLSYAAGNGDPAKVSALLRHGAEPNVADRMGAAPLHCAAEKGSAACLDLLLDAGANIDAVSKNGHTALVEAASSGQVECIELLLTRGADVAITDVAGRQALYMAVTCQQPASLLPLIRGGANINARRKNGGTALKEAVFLGSATMARCLVEHGADLDCLEGFFGCVRHEGDSCACIALVKELERMVEDNNMTVLSDEDVDSFYDAAESL